MAAYQSFTVTRTTEPDPASLLTQLRGLDATAGLQHTTGTKGYVLKKATAWTASQITAAQNTLETSPAMSPQLTAQNEIDNWPLSQKAFALALIDQLNVIRGKLVPPLATVTPQQALDAIRTKAGTL